MKKAFFSLLAVPFLTFGVSFAQAGGNEAPKQDNKPKQDQPSQNEPSQNQPKQDEPSQNQPKQDEPDQNQKLFR